MVDTPYYHARDELAARFSSYGQVRVGTIPLEYPEPYALVIDAI
jgi:hypothetical protein